MIIVDQKTSDQRLDVFLANTIDDESINRTKIQKIIEKGQVPVNGVFKKPSYKLKMGDRIDFNPDEFRTLLEEDIKVKPQKIPLDILFEDEHLLVVNKPKNMLTHPTSYESKDTLVNALLYHCKDKLSDVGGPLRRGIVHRLDKNTSGLLVVAKTNEAHNILSAQIRNKTAIRKYLAVVLGEVVTQSGVINKPISRSLKETVKMVVDENAPFAKPAKTYYYVLERFEGATFLELELETGRTHQIRVHLSSLNHPVFGDELYGAKGFKKYANVKTTGQVLQSTYLRFTHPKNSEIMEFELLEERWDADLKRVLRNLRGRSDGPMRRP